MSEANCNEMPMWH